VHSSCAAVFAEDAAELDNAVSVTNGPDGKRLAGEAA
jgi:hypothetical protein